MRTNGHVSSAKLALEGDVCVAAGAGQLSALLCCRRHRVGRQAWRHRIRGDRRAPQLGRAATAARFTVRTSSIHLS